MAMATSMLEQKPVTNRRRINKRDALAYAGARPCDRAGAESGNDIGLVSPQMFADPGQLGHRDRDVRQYFGRIAR
jgi:hypothetical protein